MSSQIRVSVVVPTYERPESIGRLVAQLDAQSLAPDDFEIVIVDDGSRQPISKVLDGVRTRCRLTVLVRTNEGPAAARDAGIRRAKGSVIVMLDDDMQVGTRFLEGHLRHHDQGPGVVVLGRIRPDPLISRMPIFERFHAEQLARLAKNFQNGTATPTGSHLYTGNVSLRREDYISAGGFDRSLRRSEDRELGLRLERRGARFVFAHGDADTVHSSDHCEAATWLNRAWSYGEHELRISRKHKGLPDADPWSFIEVVSPWARPLYLLAALMPSLGRRGGRAALALSQLVDRAGFEVPALAGTTLAFGMSYFGGLGAESKGLSPLLWGVTRRLAGAPAWVLEKWWDAVKADHDCIRAYRARYHGDQILSDEIGRHLIEKVGFQMMAMIRLMQVLHEEGQEPAAKTLSRLIRHLHGADIHWEAKIAPGVLIVHGMGICVSREASIGPGCILFQNVTLGEGIDPVSRRVGSPRLEADVHVGPGATIIGPVTVGAGSKVMAGALLARSVSPGSLVEPPMASVQPRPKRSAVQSRSTTGRPVAEASSIERSQAP